MPIPMPCALRGDGLTEELSELREQAEHLPLSHVSMPVMACPSCYVVLALLSHGAALSLELPGPDMIPGGGAPIISLYLATGGDPA